MGCEELRRRTFGCRFPCDSLGSVLAKLKRRGMLRIGPGAAGAIEPVRLVHVEQTARLFYDSLLTTNGICNSFQSPPPRRRTIVLSDTRNVVFAHYALHGHGNISPRDASRLNRCIGDSGWIWRAKGN